MSRKRRKQEKANRPPKKNKYPKGTVGKRERERGVRKRKGGNGGGNNPPASPPEPIEFVAPPPKKKVRHERPATAAKPEIITPPREIVVPEKKLVVPATPVHKPRPSGSAALLIDDGDLW